MPRLIWAALAALLLAAVCLNPTHSAAPPAPAPAPAPSAESAAAKGVAACATIAATIKSDWGTRGVGGAAFVCRDRRTLVTCRHVVKDATKITATFEGGDPLPATVAAEDEGNDLALLTLAEDAPSPPLALARSAPTVGMTAIAVGAPLGFGHSVSRGVVSHGGRAIEYAGGWKVAGMIQTDAAINGGNSGGPLLGESGEVIGVVAASHAQARGLSWAVPAPAVGRLLARKR